MAFADQLGFEGGVAVSWRLELDLDVSAFQSLAAVAIATISSASPTRLVLGVPQVLGHFFPLARELRQLGWKQVIGFFLHVPFPSHDVFRALPGYRRLLQALGAYDLLGFQTDVDLRGFQDSVRYGLPQSKIVRGAVYFEGYSARTGVFPISIDVGETAELAAKGRASVQGRRLVESLAGRGLILGVDRLDYSKGLAERFRAFERLLTSYPATRAKVVFMQIAQPSRGDVPQYQSMRRTLNAVAGEINGRFADSGSAGRQAAGGLAGEHCVPAKVAQRHAIRHNGLQLESVA